MCLHLMEPHWKTNATDLGRSHDNLNIQSVFMIIFFIITSHNNPFAWIQIVNIKGSSANWKGPVVINFCETQDLPLVSNSFFR